MRDDFFFLDSQKTLFYWDRQSPTLTQIATAATMGITAFTLPANAVYYNGGYWFIKEGGGAVTQQTLIEIVFTYGANQNPVYSATKVRLLLLFLTAVAVFFSPRSKKKTPAGGGMHQEMHHGLRHVAGEPAGHDREVAVDQRARDSNKKMTRTTSLSHTNAPPHTHTLVTQTHTQTYTFNIINSNNQLTAVSVSLKEGRESKKMGKEEEEGEEEGKNEAAATRARRTR